MTPTVAILGAGPAGLATAACLRARGVGFRLIDRRGEPGGAYREIHEGMTLASPTVFNGLPGLALRSAGDYTRVGEYRAYLLAYAAHHQLTVEKMEVERVERDGDGFTLAARGSPSFRARFVVAATGMWDFPVVPSLPGGFAGRVLHAREWRGAASIAEERVVVVGGATSAVEIAEDLARSGRRVVVSARSGIKIARQRLLGVDLHHWVGPLDLIPTWVARKYCDTRPTLPAIDLGFSRFVDEKQIDVRPAIAAADGHALRFTDGSRADADLVLFATGFRFDTPFLPSEVARAPAGHVRTRSGESRSWPGLFLVGSPCAARLNSEFLRGVARDAPLIADRIHALARFC